MQVHRWSLDILSALEHLHGLDPVVIHRDLKPANILVTPHALKLIDFGLSKRTPREDGSPLGRSSWRHTCNIGTPRYMAPEVLDSVCAGQHSSVIFSIYTEKADIYSGALVLWYLLTGMLPNCKVRQDRRARPPLEPAMRRWPALARLVERMWEHDPEMRPSAAECVGELRSLTPAVRCGVAGGAACTLL